MLVVILGHSLETGLTCRAVVVRANAQADAFEKYNETSVTDCMKKLKKTNEKLKKFDGVNKKALDQFMSFTEQRDDLQGRESTNSRAIVSGILRATFLRCCSPG